MNYSVFRNKIHFGKRELYQGAAPYIIAEAGVAHFGSIQKAYALVDLAVGAGADCVKFQHFCIDELYSETEQGWRDRLSSKQMSISNYSAIRSYCEKKGIDFACTGHDLPSFTEVMSLSPTFIKIGSGERGNFEYIRKAADYNIPLIISTGMYSEEDIDRLCTFLEEIGKTDVVLLHCVTAYPAKPQDIRLSYIKTLREKYNILVGYSDHTEGYHIPLAAIQWGAVVIEKHISLDFNVPNAQDWKVSCGPRDLENFVKLSRECFEAVGEPKKSIGETELLNSRWATKAAYYSKDLSVGDKLTLTDIKVMRPATSLPLDSVVDLMGKSLLMDVKAGHPVMREQYET